MTDATGTRSRRLGALAATAVFVAVGCGTSASSGGNPPGAPSTVGTGASLRHPLTPEQVAAELVAGARVPPGATELTSSPVPSLARPPSEPSVVGRIERVRWWRIDQPMAQVYAEVARHQSPSLAYDARSSAGGPALSDQVKATDYTYRSVPLSVNSASFAIAVAPLTDHSSAIGAYAIVVQQPRRPINENVPPTLDRVRLAEDFGPTADYASPGPQLPAPVTVTGQQAQQIVVDFNQLRVRPDGVQSCPMALREQTATFTYDDHTLVATIGVCGAVNVTLDDHALPTLDPTANFVHDVTAPLQHHLVSGHRRLPASH